MVKTLIIAMQLLGITSFAAQAQKKASPAAKVTDWTYVGKDDVKAETHFKAGEFFSPTLQDCYQYQSIKRKGKKPRKL